MTANDPIEMFNSLDPTPYLETASVDVEQRNDDILAYVLSQPRETDETPPTRSRPRRWIIGGGLGVAILATAAFAVLRTEPVSDPRGITCMASSDGDGDRIGLPADSDPVAACRVLWKDGTLGDGEPPSLAACINDAGAAVVFPSGDDICSRLGLAEAAPGLADDQQRIVTLQESLAATFLSDCFAQDDAIAEAQRQLDGSGLEGWTVDVPESFADSGLCAAPGIDLDNQRIFLIGGREA